MNRGTRGPNGPRRRVPASYAALLAGGLVALALGWVALGPASAPALPDRYVEGIVGEPGRVNPLFAAVESPEADLVALLFNGLTRIAADGTPLPDLADRWEITADGLTYTFHLRRAVFWHDGESFTSADVAFTIGRVQAPGFQGPSQLASAWAGVEVLAVDAHTVVMRLPAPSAAFPVTASLGIVPEHLLRDLGVSELLRAPFNRAPVGTGPYRLVSLSARAARLERAPGYHLDTPALKRLEFRFYASDADLAAALAAGEVEGALLAVAAGGAGGASMSAGLSARPLVVGGYTALFLNNQRRPLSDPALRRAITAAIDRPALVSSPPGGGDIAGWAVAGDGPFVPGTWAYTRSTWPAPSEADALFETAGWRLDGDGRRTRDGELLRLELVTNTDPLREAVAASVAAQLEARGVTIELRVLPSRTLLRERIDPRQYDLLLFGWTTGVDPDPYGAWHTSQIATAGRNIAGYHDPAADRLLEAARVTADSQERRELYARFSERFVETAPSVVLYYPRRQYVQPAALSGVSTSVLFRAASRFRDVHLWRYQPRED